MAATPTPVRLSLGWTVLVMAGVPLLFWAATGQVWEDFLITFRASHNLAIGQGLTYTPGTRICSFTSPLNTLLPAFYDWLTGTDSYELPLRLYVLTSVAAFVAGGVVLVRLQGSADGVERTGVRWAFPVLLALCLRTVAYVVNGQEAGFWTLGLALAFTATVRGLERSWKLAGCAWALLMWTRPDSCVHIALFSAIAVLLAPAGGRRGQLVGIAKAAGLCTLGYLPWFLGAWAYYGSPLSLSMRAKLGAFVGPDLPWPRTPLGLRLWDGIAGGFDPIYETGRPLFWVSFALAVVAAGAFLIPRASRLTRASSLAFLGSVAYLEFVWSTGTAFPWYFVPACVFGCLTLACVYDEAAARPPPGMRWAGRGVVIAGLLLLGHFFTTALPLYAAKQRFVDDTVRRRIGLWLKGQVRPDEHVFLEPCGYIGYYSGARLYDYPGLTDPAVVQWRRKGDGFFGLIRDLRPEWLVLRTVELAGLRERPQLAAAYRVVQTFDNDPEIRRRLPQLASALDYDSHFTVLVRQSARP